MYPSRVRLNVSTRTRTGASCPWRCRRSSRTAICSRKRSSAVVVFPLPAAPLMMRNPGLTSASTLNCSGVGVTEGNSRISNSTGCRPHCLGPRGMDSIACVARGKDVAAGIDRPTSPTLRAVVGYEESATPQPLP